jgi:AmmeMemoRadiSam system protein B/AmmeMemoRadiSam system protein A
MKPKPRLIPFALCFLLLTSCTSTPTQKAAPPEPALTIPAKSVRPAQAEGGFYPDDPATLTATVDGYMKAVQPAQGEPVALLVPHASYEFSGAVAACGFGQLRGKDVRTAVIIASDHQGPLADPIAVWTQGGWQTPLGVVSVDGELARALAESDPRIKADSAAFAGEHPIEAELPFLQRVCPQCRIVPVLISSTEPEDVRALAGALARLLPGRHAVIIASSDLSHYPSYKDARRADSALLKAIVSFKPDAVRATTAKGMNSGTPNLVTCACGEAAILTAMEAARSMGADKATLLRQATSGDVPGGDKGRVVGYGAVMFWRSGARTELSESQRALLLNLARAAISSRLADRPIPTPIVNDPALLEPRGAFVTLKIRGELRGCIGDMEARTPLYQTIQNMAQAAAFEDYRFLPVTRDEFPLVTVEISVLSPMKKISSPNDIQIGRDGVVIDKAMRRGVFLPQVPVEQGWKTREVYLEHLCGKAGLPPGCWKSGATLYTFTAEVFGKAKP